MSNRHNVLTLKRTKNMARPVTLCTLQWGDLPLDVICGKAKSFGFDGVELGLPSHLDVRQTDPEYYRNIKVTLEWIFLLVAVIRHFESIVKSIFWQLSNTIVPKPSDGPLK